MLLMPTGSVHFPRTGLAKEWGKGMINYLASWIVVMSRAKKSTAVQRHQWCVMQTLCVQLFVHSLVLLHQWNGIVGVCDVIFNTRALLLAQV